LLQTEAFFRIVRRDSHRGAEQASNQTPDRFEQATPSYKIAVAKRRVTIDFWFRFGEAADAHAP
jgi:hypothetical protein